MNKESKTFIICFAIAFIIWTMPFVLRITSNYEYHQVQKNNKTECVDNSKGVVTNIFKAYSSGDRKEVFKLIFFNNIKVTIINILGGIFLGLGTFVNLAQNGFYSADVFCSVHYIGAIAIPLGSIFLFGQLFSKFIF